MSHSLTRATGLFIALTFTLFGFPALATNPDAAGTTCEISYELNNGEREAFDAFKLRLQQVDISLGKRSFEGRLNKIIAAFGSPEAKVIEYSPLFLYKIEYLKYQKYLEDSIARTIGLNHPAWQAFAIEVRRVNTAQVLLPATLDVKRFTTTTKKLLDAIAASPITDPRTKAIATSWVTVVYTGLTEFSAIHSEIRRQRTQKYIAQLKVGTGVVLSAGAMVATVIYSGPILATAAAMTSSFATDAVVAVNLAKIGQILAGTVLGGTGAPTALFLQDSAQSLLEASRLSANNRTLYICELDHQLKEWKNRGVAPYLRAALTGASIATGGGALTLTRLGQHVVLYATNFGVHVATLYSIGRLSSDTMHSLAEYQMAKEAIEQGDRAGAVLHLKQARQYAASAGQMALESALVGVLSFELATEFPRAVREGESVIRTLFASSADTLPTSVNILRDVVLSIRGSQDSPQAP